MFFAISRTVLFLLIISFVLIFTKAAATGGCPCRNVTHCLPIQGKPRKELFAFHGSPPTSEAWKKYNWSHITTLGFVGTVLNQEMYCFAHSLGVRIVKLVDPPVDILFNETAVDAWVKHNVDIVLELGIDGLNVDFENWVNTSQSAALTKLMEKLSKVIRRRVSGGGQLSMDVPTKPHTKVLECKNLSTLCDFFVVMDYDDFWGCNGPTKDSPCYAEPNSPMQAMETAFKSWMNLLPGQPEKLIFGFPWYGYSYRCNGTNPQVEECRIAHVWDNLNFALNYLQIMNLTRNGTLYPSYKRISPIVVDLNQSAVRFNYLDTQSSSIHQVWYDNPATISAKCDLAQQYGLLGVSMWNMDMLAYDPETEGMETAADTAAMWAALNSFFS